MVQDHFWQNAFLTFFVGPPRSLWRKKEIFSKKVLRRRGMLKQVSSTMFEPVVTRFGPWKILKCLRNGLFRDRKRVKTVYTHCARPRLPSGSTK